MRKILVTGSREFTDFTVIQRALSVERALANGERMIVIHGAAKGADSIAGELARLAYNCSEVSVPADWANDPKSGPLGAGPVRNRVMLALGPDVVLAFYKDGAKNIGTRGMVAEARKAGIEVKEWTA